MRGGSRWRLGTRIPVRLMKCLGLSPAPWGTAVITPGSSAERSPAARRASPTRGSSHSPATLESPYLPTSLKAWMVACWPKKVM